ncbi:MAG TPA: hypothetical protein EYP09_02060 [Anaerolineae bacterium]|nr:hypothetical protein [Anaerolineae bacterium]
MPGGYRYRNMFYATGLPGWMRFGYSPGWGGLPPGAQYLMQSGQMPQFWSWMQAQAPFRPMGGAWGWPTPMGAPPAMTKEQEVQLLQGQAKMLEGQLEQIKKRIEELEKE